MFGERASIRLQLKDRPKWVIPWTRSHQNECVHSRFCGRFSGNCVSSLLSSTSFSNFVRSLSSIETQFHVLWSTADAKPAGSCAIILPQTSNSRKAVRSEMLDGRCWMELWATDRTSRWHKAEHMVGGNASMVLYAKAVSKAKNMEISEHCNGWWYIDAWVLSEWLHTAAQVWADFLRDPNSSNASQARVGLAVLRVGSLIVLSTLSWEIALKIAKGCLKFYSCLHLFSSRLIHSN